MQQNVETQGGNDRDCEDTEEAKKEVLETSAGSEEEEEKGNEDEALRNDWQLALEEALCRLADFVAWYKERLCPSALYAPPTAAVTFPRFLQRSYKHPRSILGCSCGAIGLRGGP